ncbi:MAG: serine/threonine-protein kinase [Planctomycetota bacterium]
MTVAGTPRIRDVQSSDARVGARIGPYTLREILGEGGFGAVYLAEQTEPVRRKVAFKVLKLGMDSEQVLQRFDAERQAMALMDHPGIAAVLDAGLTERGRPYFVMELVRGKPLNAFCDDHKLNTRARLELFVHVCRAVQHAHMKGVIHRDLKPSNVLVREIDGGPAPKIIDFGISKAVSGPLTENPAHTRAEQMLGTPQYMSPEQAGGLGVDVDTRADVYSLGVILYELLTGSTPLKAETLVNATMAELPGLLREQPTQRPSQRLATLGADSGMFTRTHGTTVDDLRSELKGDLDWIVLKAVEKERDRRYATPDALADDVLRHMRHEAVLASPPSRSYRVRKFVRRNRLGVGAAAVVALAVIAGGAAAGVGFYRASVQRDAAVQAEARAVEARDQARTISDLLVNIFVSAEPENAGADVTVLDALRQAEPRLAAFSDNLPVRAVLHKTMGDVYLALDAFERAEWHLNAALADAETIGGRDALLTLEIRDSITELLRKEQDDPLVARAEAERLVEDKRRVLGAEHISLAVSLRTLGKIHQGLSDYESAELAFDEALRIQTAVLGAEDPEAAATLVDIGRIRSERGSYAEALEAIDPALAALAAQFNERHPEAIRARTVAARVLRDQGEYATAARRFSDLIEDASETFGATHTRTIEVRGFYAQTLLLQGELDDAAAQLETVAQQRAVVLGTDHPDTVAARQDLGQVLRRLGDLPRARRELEAVLEHMRENLGPEHQQTFTTAANLANIYIDLDEQELARTLLRRTLADHERINGEDHPTSIGMAINFAGLIGSMGEADDAQAMLEKAVDRAAEVFGEDHPTRLAAMGNLALLYRRQEKYDLAEPLYRETLAAQDKALGERHQTRLRTANNLAELLRLQGRWDEAAEVHRDTLALRAEALGPDHDDTRVSLRGLTRTAEGAARSDPALGASLARGSDAALRSIASHCDPNYLWYRLRLALLAGPEADDWCTELMRCHETALASPEADPIAQFRAAEFFAMAPSPGFRDPARVVEIGLSLGNSEWPNRFEAVVLLARALNEAEAATDASALLSGIDTSGADAETQRVLDELSDEIENAG